MLTAAGIETTQFADSTGPLEFESHRLFGERTEA
jgi:hypothetical protein